MLNFLYVTERVSHRRRVCVCQSTNSIAYRARQYVLRSLSLCQNYLPSSSVPLVASSLQTDSQKIKILTQDPKFYYFTFHKKNYHKIFILVPRYKTRHRRSLSGSRVGHVIIIVCEKLRSTSYVCGPVTELQRHI